ncbi:4Fe-4S dicluster domain-containing protein, partial [Fundidesulfovibrio magnetotacticus]|uniref:4Fe-4S dicluster domain-containing protein n=1 Tax=Fundidesulfovibrio magnetotacticus TaxID=2730080 RepID=UPI00156323CC
MSAKYLPGEKLAAWLEELSGSRLVLVPVMERDAVVFRPFASNVPVELGRQANVPPKDSVFPATERLMRFRYVKDPDDLGKVSLELEETVEAPPTVVVGGRPCDARGFTVFDRVYNSPRATDVYYQARRENTLFVTLSCDDPDNACFCHCVGSSPSDARGSDVMLTPVEGGFLVEQASERASELLGSALLTDASEASVSQAQAARVAALEALGERFDPAQAPAKLLEKFDDLGFWEDVSAKCISCGACTYLCPTCYCFNVTDERTGMTGERIRTWDTCMSFQFTLEASGH